MYENIKYSSLHGVGYWATDWFQPLTQQHFNYFLQHIPICILRLFLCYVALAFSVFWNTVSILNWIELICLYAFVGPSNRKDGPTLNGKYLIQQAATPSSERLWSDCMAAGHLCSETLVPLLWCWRAQQQDRHWTQHHSQQKETDATDLPFKEENIK